MKTKATLKITGHLTEDNATSLTAHLEGKPKDISFLLYTIMDNHPDTIPIFKAAVEIAEIKAGMEGIKNILNPSKN